MIRFLIVLEVVLLALLGVRWFEAGAASRSGDLPASQTAAIPAARLAAPATLSAPIPDLDRVRLARDLLGATAGGMQVPVAARGIEPDHEVRAKSGILVADQAVDPAEVAEAQRLLRRLGYAPGAADGVWGPRTERAIDAWRRRSGRLEGGGVVDASLLPLLRDEVRIHASVTAPRRSVRGARPGHSAPASQNDSGAQPEWVSLIAGGFQRLIGREFDSRRNPQRIRDYCTGNRETWIFDEGSRNFLWCGRSPQS